MKNNTWRYQDYSLGDGQTNHSMGFKASDVQTVEDVSIRDIEGLGRALFLDDEIQTCEFDEHVYHETIVHWPMATTARLSPKDMRVLVIGGGDGGCVRELLKYPSNVISEIDWCEININVVRLCERHMSSFKISEAMNSSRANFFNKDGFDFVHRAAQNKKEYDVIILDLSDPVGPARRLFDVDFYIGCSQILSKGGRIITQCPTFYVAPDFVRYLKYALSFAFPEKRFRYTQVPIPTYPFGNIGFIKMGGVDDSFSHDIHQSWGIKTKFFDREITVTHAMKKLSVNRRLENFHWHCKNFFDWKACLTPKELDYVDLCCQLDGEPSVEDSRISNFTFSHRVEKKDHVNSGRMACGSIAHPLFLSEKVNAIIKERGVDVSFFTRNNIPINGLGWDAKEGHFKIYALVSQAKMEKVFPDLKRDDESEWGIVSVTYEGKKIAERKIYYCKCSYTNMVTSVRGVVRQYNMGLQEFPNCDVINDFGKSFVRKYEKQGMKLDTLAFQNPHNFTLYFEN